MRPRVDDAAHRELDELAFALAQALVGPHAQQVGEALEDVDMGILRLGGVPKQVAPRVVPAPPLAAEGVKVAPVDRVMGVLLDQAVDRNRLLQRRDVARRAVVFRQAVDSEDLPVHLLVRIVGLAVRADRPEQAAVLLVDEPVDEVAVGPSRHFQVFRVAVGAVGG